MLRLLVFSLFVGAILAVDSDDLLGQKPAVKTDYLDANSQHYALLSQYKEIVAGVQSVAGGMIELRISSSRTVVLPPDPKKSDKDKKDDKKDDRGDNGLQKQLDHLERELAQLRKGKKDSKGEKQKEAKLVNQIQQTRYRIQANNAQEQQQKLIQAMKDRAARTKIDTDFIDFELPFAKDAIVRKLQAGIEYDDKGFPKEMPAANEKGLPGYPAERSDLTKGDIVKVYLSPPSPIAAAAVKDATGFVVPADRPFVRLIVIISDNPMPAEPKKKSS